MNYKSVSVHVKLWKPSSSHKHDKSSVMHLKGVVYSRCARGSRAVGGNQGRHAWEYKHNGNKNAAMRLQGHVRQISGALEQGTLHPWWKTNLLSNRVHVYCTVTAQDQSTSRVLRTLKGPPTTSWLEFVLCFVNFYSFYLIVGSTSSVSPFFIIYFLQSPSPPQFTLRRVLMKSL